MTSTVTEKYYFDLNTQLLVVGPALRAWRRWTWVAAPSPTRKVRPAPRSMRLVISCDECSGVDEGMSAEQLLAVNARVGFVTRNRLKEKDALERLPRAEPCLRQPQMMTYLDFTPLVSTLAGETWLPEEAPAAMDLMAAAFQCDGGAKPKVCRP